MLSFFGMSAPIAVAVGLAVAAGFGWSVGSMLENSKRNSFNERFLAAIEDFHRMVHFGIATGQAYRLDHVRGRRAAGRVVAEGPAGDGVRSAAGDGPRKGGPAGAHE